MAQPQPQVRPQPTTTAPVQGEISTLLGKGSSFEGKLIFEGTVRIDGMLSGEIFSEDVLVIGEGASVKAQIEVGVLIVQGSVEGNIRAQRAVELHAPARVRGNLETPSLFIDKGVIFEGQCKMEGLGLPHVARPEQREQKEPPKPPQSRKDAKDGKESKDTEGA